jgi:tetratricopeptide (TPR) repeat protein
MPRSTKGLMILGFLVALTMLTAIPGSAEFAALIGEADSLLNSPDLTFPQAEKALTIYEGILHTPRSESLLLLPRLGRVCFILGDMAPKNQRKYYYEKGLYFGEWMARDHPQLTEGHYWVAMNLCGLADVEGYMAARRLLPRIFEELTLAVSIDETYDQAGAHRVLGRIYCEAPDWPMSVGDPEKSLHHLRAAVRLAPNNSTNHLYLAQTLLRLHRDALAWDELQKVMNATDHAPNPKGVEEDRQEARRLSAEYLKDHAAAQNFEGSPRHSRVGGESDGSHRPWPPSPATPY